MPPIDPATPRGRENSADDDPCYAAYVAWYSPTIGAYS